MPAPERRTSAAARRRVLPVVFLTLFIDLIGFSIIFPLFPSMLVHYRETEGDTGLFGWVYSGLEQFTYFAGASEMEWGVVVLFGGVLGSIYSLLQFIFAPLFGALSDRIGRKPVILVSLTGILCSYLMWFFAGSFALFFFSRILGGIMSANISTATAVVADVTDEKTRSKGMALIGIAFGLGFIFGPLIGGLSSHHLDLPALWPALAEYGVNPYSAPAGVALVLTAFNIGWVLLRLPETRPKSARRKPAAQRTNNPLVLLRTEAYPGVSRTNLIYFLFLLAFSGMEFSLVFLAVDRLGYTLLQNTYMFLFVGTVMIVVQGGYVHRRAAQVGAMRMAGQGLFLLIPGLATVGLASAWQSNLALYLGLLMLAIGAALATPCLTTLVSVYAPRSEQGRIMGIFRSLGALARAIGPLLACVAYWRLGAELAYYLGALSILVPLLLMRKLPAPKEAAARPRQARAQGKEVRQEP